MGHIRFWRISSTFTGLKLQGAIGKFGASELSDIAAFAQFPDGKVLSSTETGNLLLWDGGMIKCEVAVKGKKSCHAGRIEVVQLYDNEILTAGEDGYVRLWDFETIDNADLDSIKDQNASGSSAAIQPFIFEISPLEEILIGKDVKIINVIRSPSQSNEYVVQDQKGNLIRLDIKKRTHEKIMSYHSGTSICDTSHLLHSMVSLGIDGTLRLYNYASKAMIARINYLASGTAICYLPEVKYRNKIELFLKL